MSCFSPIKAWFGPRNENGKYPLVFNPKDASIGGHPISQVEVPCGYCVGCRIDRSRAWAIRCVHEASLHDLNCFVTLTYAVAPQNNSLVKKDLQDFWKRLRKSIFPLTLRYFACGEYGSKGDRPHYHACIFGWRPHDLVTFGSHYSSEFLARVWGHGFVTVGDVTHASAAYVAQYVIKKQYGPDVDYGDREPEYVVMSRRPGIASDWISHNLDDVYGYHDAVSIDGRLVRVPRFYDSYFESVDPKGLQDLKLERIKRMMNFDQAEREGSRQYVKSQVAKHRVMLAQDRRSYE